ncbi:MAG: ABC transporter ATP-binding protein [Gammaproteobacteria bacterium]
MTTTEAPPLLRVSDLFKDYRLGESPVSVLKGLNLNVPEGEMLAIMGPSGVGKTTLLNCISGIDAADSGTIEVDGAMLSGAGERERTRIRRERIGMVFQFFNLIPTLTARENVALPFKIMGREDADSADRVDEMLERTGLGRRAGHYAFQLSGGEMQLVSIARALVHRPPLLLADEPTGNVNPAVGRSIMEILSGLAAEQRTSVIMVTHSPEHAAWADRVAFIKDGVIASTRQHGRDREHVGPLYDALMELEI